MFYKNFKFRRNRKIVTFPQSYWGEKEVYFGRVCGETEEGAIATEWTLNGAVVYAKPIVAVSHERANMMYGADGKVYLFHNNECFVAQISSIGKYLFKKEKLYGHYEVDVSA